MELTIKNRKFLYKHTNSKIYEDKYLSRLMTPIEPQRRNKTPSRGIAKNCKLSCSYFILSKKKKHTLVWKKFFMAVFEVKDKRLTAINNTCFKGEIPKANRGGDHRSHKTAAKKESLKQFINKLPARESHYNREKSKRIYLNSELNVRKLLKLYHQPLRPCK